MMERSNSRKVTKSEPQIRFIQLKAEITKISEQMRDLTNTVYEISQKVDNKGDKSIHTSSSSDDSSSIDNVGTFDNLRSRQVAPELNLQRRTNSQDSSYRE